MEYFPEDDNYIYTIAQFFPRMAVYSEVEGWQNHQFTGRSEFALPFGDYQVEITVPEEVMGDVMGDLNGRRGRVLGMDAQGKYQIIKAQAPMAEVLTYALDLNSMSGGRGTFRMEHSHYEELPAQLTEKVVAAAKEEE